MKKIVNNAVYDTATATVLAIFSDKPRELTDPKFFCEWLCKTDGNYFLYGTGGSQTKYSSKDEIIPLSPSQALKWLADRYDLCEEEMISQEQAMQDVISFFEAMNPNDPVFAEAGTTKATVLADSDTLEAIAAEHLHCVNRFGNDREWSCRDACLFDPGFGRKED